MTIEVPQELEAALIAAARKQDVTPEALALDVLRAKYGPRPSQFEPRDEWERRLLAIATDCGVPLPETEYSREEMYD